ncbi:MAG: hypothetical protein R3E10_19400 [Gemmatimonadota bacterium]
MKIPHLFEVLWADERGQDLVEYVALALIVSAAVVAAIVVLRGQLQILFGSASAGVANPS